MKEEIQEKPPKRPPHHKKVLAPVLTILSKSSNTGTRQQDSTNSKAKKDDSKQKVSPKNTLENIPSVTPPYSLDFDLDKKRKYRSKILSKYQADNFEVLQSKKERFRTSSNSSVNDKEDTKWKSELPRLVPPAPDEIQNDDKYKTLVREVTEGKKLAEKKNKVFDPDPPTLVAEQAHMDDKKMYNFFVDLLHSTFNTYNVDSQYDKEPVPSTASSKIALEINESVASKLNVATEMHKRNELQKPFDYAVRNEYDHWNESSFQHNTQYTRSYKHTKVNRETPKSAVIQTRIRKEYEPRRILSSRSQSAEYNRAEERPSFYRKQKKRDLLNILKEELRMEPVSFEEPQNLYEALKVMAKQKRTSKPEKILRFHNKTKSPADCKLLKGRRFVLNNKARKRDEDTTDVIVNYGGMGKKKSDLGGYRKNISEEDSNHSLEVYSYERFAPNRFHKRETDQWKQRRRLMHASYPGSSSSKEL